MKDFQNGPGSTHLSLMNIFFSTSENQIGKLIKIVSTWKCAIQQTWFQDS